MLLGKFLCVFGTTPNNGDEGDVLGLSNKGVFIALNADARNSNRCFSFTRNSRITERSICGAEWRRIPGLRSLAVRSVSEGRCTQMAANVSNQWLRLCPPASFGSP